jgi:hypothetical protein
MLLMMLYVVGIDGVLFLFWDAVDAIQAIWSVGAARCTLRPVSLALLAGIS